MIKESKYILRRILVGVGIVLVLGFLRSNKVFALENVQVSWLNLPYDMVSSNDSYQLLAQSGSQRIFRNRDSGDFAFCWTTSSECDIMNPSDYFEYTNVGLMIKSTSDVYQNIAYFTNDSTLPIIGSGGSAPVNLTSRTFSVKLYKIGSLTRTPSIVSKIGNSGEIPFTLNGYGSYFNFYSNTSWDNHIKTATSFDILPPSASKIISLNPVKLNSENGVIITYLFSPEFSNFNTDNFVYQYKFGNGTTWLSLTENEQVFRVNNNGTIYVRVKDKNSNEVVDSQTFTITDIGTFATQQDYDISFSGEYRTLNYLNNTTCVSSSNESVIKEYQIYIDYLPKASILKYQYQYVNDGDSLDSNNWSNVSSLDNGSITYVASQNGTLYARILDSTDNVLYTDTFTVDSIGKLGIDSKDNCVKNFFTKISSNINYGGPVSSLFVIPVNTLNSLYSSMSNSSSCSPIQLGSLLGTNMQFGCYNFKSIVGNEVYNIIDIIFAFVLTIGVFKFILKLYNNFISMKEV